MPADARAARRSASRAGRRSMAGSRTTCRSTSTARCVPFEPLVRAARAAWPWRWLRPAPRLAMGAWGMERRWLVHDNQRGRRSCTSPLRPLRADRSMLCSRFYAVPYGTLRAVWRRMLLRARHSQRQRCPPTRAWCTRRGRGRQGPAAQCTRRETRSGQGGLDRGGALGPLGES